MSGDVELTSEPQVRSSAVLEVLRRYWKDRIDRKKTQAQGFAKHGDYYLAARLWSEAEATDLCLKDLETESTSNDQAHPTAADKKD